MNLEAGAVRTGPGYVDSISAVSAYPLSGYDPTWGWGLGLGLSGMAIHTHFNFYSLSAVYDNILYEGIIDWNNPQTNINETLSGVEYWLQDDGVVS